jgi:DNA-binding NtrC family response regulator
MKQRRPEPGGVKILVVDDDRQVRELFAMWLELAGYGVSQAKSGREALKSLRRERFDILVLDLEMPDMDGFDVLKTTRSEFADLKVLVVSGYLEGALLKAAECLGAAASLNKTHASDSLVKMVRRLVGES